MKKILLTILLLCTTNTAFSAPISRCVIEVDGQVHLDEPCQFIDIGDGNFTIGVGDSEASQYFAYVYIDNETQSFWNGAAGGNHAHQPLGVLTRNGACWKSETSKICAYK